MKKIFTILFFFISYVSFGQFPNTIGEGDKKLQTFDKGARGADSGFVFRTQYADTADLNRGWLDGIPGIICRTSGDYLWLRNNTATAWVLIGGTGGVATNIYNSNGTLSGNRTVELSTFNLDFSRSGLKQLGLQPTSSILYSPDNTRYLGLYNDSIVIKGLATSPGVYAIRVDANGHLFRADTTIGSQGLQDVITNDPILTSNVDIYPDVITRTLAFGDTREFASINLYGGLNGVFLRGQNGATFSEFTVLPDSILFQANNGLIHITGLPTATDTSVRKPMVYNTSNGRWEYLTYWPGGGAAQGIFSNSLINRQADSLQILKILKSVAVPDSLVSTSDSYGMPYAVITDSLYNKKASDYWALTFYNIGLSGSGVWYSAKTLNASLPIGASVITNYQCGLNDVRRWLDSLLLYRKIINCHKSAVASATLNSFAAGGSAGGSGMTITRVGTWTTTYASSSVGGRGGSNGAYTNTVNDTIKCTYTGTNIVLLGIGADGTTNIYSSSFDVYVDDVLQANYSEDQQTDGISDGVYDNKRIPMAWFFTGQTSGSHTIKIVNKNANFLVIDGFGQLKEPENTTPFVAWKVPYLDVIGYATAPSPANGLILTTRVNTKLDSLYATVPFSTHPAFLLNMGLDTLTDFIGDHIHPNAAANNKMRDTMIYNVLFVSPDGGGTASDGMVIKIAGHLYLNNDGTYTKILLDGDQTPGTGVDALSVIGSTPNVNGGTITGTTFNLEPASVSFGGVVTTGAQSFIGVKTFTQQVIFKGFTTYDPDVILMQNSAGQSNWQFGNLSGAPTWGVMWGGNITPAAGNYTVQTDGATSVFNSGTTTYVRAANGTGTQMVMNATGTVFGGATPVSMFSVGSSNQFQVNSTGDIVKLNNVTTTFPSANAAGVLTNNGSGTLTWAAASGGLTVGTSTITSGSTTNILYNNAGILGEYTITGTGTVVAMQTSPSFTTSVLTGSTTLAVFNTTATTVNAFGAATTINMGLSAATVLNFGGFTSAAEFRFLEPSGSGTNYTSFKAVAQAANAAYTLPTGLPAGNDYVLGSSTAGALSWLAPSVFQIDKTFDSIAHAIDANTLRIFSLRFQINDVTQSPGTGTTDTTLSYNLLVPTIVSSADYTGLTATQTLDTYTTPDDGTIGIYNVSVHVTVTAVSAGILTTTVTYTDHTNNSRTVTFYGMGTTTAGLSVTGVSNFAVMGELSVRPNTTITVTSTLTIGTMTYDAGCSVLFIRNGPVL